MNNEPVGYFGKDPYGNWEELNENHGIPLYTHPVKEDAQYDKGFDDGCKHTKKIYEAEIEALKESINEALASIPAYGEQGFYGEHHDINGEYLGYSTIHAENVVQNIEAILRKASEK